MALLFKIRVTWAQALWCHESRSDNLDGYERPAQRMIHIPKETEQDSAGVYHATQNGMQIKMCELFLEFSI